MSKNFSVNVFVSAICHDGNGKLLMARRGGQARDRHGEWEFGGGALESGETLEEAVRRETKEELGVELLEVEQLHTHEFQRDSGLWLGVFFLCKVNPEEVFIAEPVYDKFDWFEPDKLPKPSFEIADIIGKKAEKFL